MDRYSFISPVQEVLESSSPAGVRASGERISAISDSSSGLSLDFTSVRVSIPRDVMRVQSTDTSNNETPPSERLHADPLTLNPSDRHDFADTSDTTEGNDSPNLIPVWTDLLSCSKTLSDLTIPTTGTPPVADSAHGMAGYERADLLPSTTALNDSKETSTESSPIANSTSRNKDREYSLSDEDGCSRHSITTPEENNVEHVTTITSNTDNVQNKLAITHVDAIITVTKETTETGSQSSKGSSHQTKTTVDNNIEQQQTMTHWLTEFPLYKPQAPKQTDEESDRVFPWCPRLYLRKLRFNCLIRCLGVAFGLIIIGVLGISKVMKWSDSVKYNFTELAIIGTYLLFFALLLLMNLFRSVSICKRFTLDVLRRKHWCNCWSVTQVLLLVALLVWIGITGILIYYVFDMDTSHSEITKLCNSHRLNNKVYGNSTTSVNITKLQ